MSTSETNVTVSLDPAANTLDQQLVDALVAELSELCRVQVLGPCASVSLVGRNIRGILHQLGEAFELFAEQRIYLLSQAANDLNFTFVVDEAQGDRLVNELHERLIRPVRAGAILGPTWEQLFAQPDKRRAGATPIWWRARRAELLALAEQHDCAYVYDPAVVAARAPRAEGPRAVERVLYAMKANPESRQILRLLAAERLAFECVSRGEIEHLLRAPCRGSIAGPDPVYARTFAGARRISLGARSRRHADDRQPVRAAPLGRAVPRPQRVHSHRYRHRSRPSPSCAHGRRALQVRRAAGGSSTELRRSWSSSYRRHASCGLHAHSGSGIFNADNWSEVAELPARSVEAVSAGARDRRRRRPRRAGCGTTSPRLDLRALDTALLAARENRTRASRSGSSRAATWWPSPVC